MSPLSDVLLGPQTITGLIKSHGAGVTNSVGFTVNIYLLLGQQPKFKCTAQLFGARQLPLTFDLDLLFGLWRCL